MHLLTTDINIVVLQVLITEITNDGKFFAQHVDEGPKLEQLMKQIREEFVGNQPLTGAFTPKRGMLIEQSKGHSSCYTIIQCK